MSRYVMTQDQLEHLKEQIKQLVRITEAKEQQIRNLEVCKVRKYELETPELIRTIDKLQEEVNNLKKINKKLSSEAQAEKTNALKVKELEKLVGEERKLTEYSESLAKQVELKFAEESLIRELTAELCQLQREEIEINNKKIMELKKRLNQYTNEISDEEQVQETVDDENMGKKRICNSEIKTIICKLQTQMANVYDSISKSSSISKEEENHKREVERWLNEIESTMDDVVHIKHLQKNLNSLKNEIESKRKSNNSDQE